MEARTGITASSDWRNISTVVNGKTDAIYRYYLHGPLARVELGHEKLQGIDYAYTLQGWLKGINGSHLNPAVEIGQDGANGVGKDVMAYSLGYFSDDYKPVNAAAEAFQLKYGAETEDITGHALYNGNISHTTVALYQLPGTTPVGYTYRYDQLNRLVKQRQHALTAATTNWGLAQYTNDYKENIDYDGNGNILKYVRNSADGALMDTMSYFYPRNAASRLVNNRLRHVKDYVSTPAITSDIETQVDDNYLYDNIGNLIRDSKESITKIEWTVYGKIRKITKTGSSLEYAYDPAGNRVYKQETVGSTVNKTWYVRDAQGNVLGVYGNKNGDAVTYWKEQHLYGSSRLGMWMPDINIVGGTSSTPWNSPGNRRYELANHLGNVLSTISDAAKVDFYPIVENAQDYYPFGMMQPGRTYKRVAGSSYRYGFNGKENDNEIKGEGNQLAFEERTYDPRVGRFLSRDPLAMKYPFQSDYAYAANNPVRFIDVLGMGPGDPEVDPAWFKQQSLWMKFRVRVAQGTQWVLDGNLTAWTETGERNQTALVNYTAPILLGSGNGTIRTLSLGTINISSEQLGLSGQDAASYDRSSYSAASVPSPLTFPTGGTGSAPSLALAGSAKISVDVVKPFATALNMPALRFANSADNNGENTQQESAPDNNFTLNKQEELTDGNYTVSKELMKKHVFGGYQGRSVFYPSLDADEAVLKAARFADEAGLWNLNVGTKAKVPVFNTNIGTTGLGEPTNIINVYRKPNGIIHGTPGKLKVNEKYYKCN